MENCTTSAEGEVCRNSIAYDDRAPRCSTPEKAFSWESEDHRRWRVEGV
jgi:hypothetical protein